MVLAKGLASDVEAVLADEALAVAGHDARAGALAELQLLAGAPHLEVTHWFGAVVLKGGSGLHTREGKEGGESLTKRGNVDRDLVITSGKVAIDAASNAATPTPYILRYCLGLTSGASLFNCCVPLSRHRRAASDTARAKNPPTNRDVRI